MQYGSLQNLLLADGKLRVEDIKPGLGATKLLWSDREAYTVIDVIRFKTGAKKGEIKGVIVQKDKCVKGPDYNYFSNQQYTYVPDSEGHTNEVFLRKNGKWSTRNGVAFAIGYRSEYQDPTF